MGFIIRWVWVILIPLAIYQYNLHKNLKDDFEQLKREDDCFEEKWGKYGNN